MVVAVALAVAAVADVVLAGALLFEVVAAAAVAADADAVVLLPLLNAMHDYEIALRLQQLPRLAQHVAADVEHELSYVPYVLAESCVRTLLHCIAVDADEHVLDVVDEDY